LELRHGLDLRLEQRLKLAPQIIQSIEILQLPIMELRERIEQELEQNPVLEISEPQMETVAGADEGEGEAGTEESNEQEEFSDELEQLLKMEDEWREYLSRSTSSAAAQEKTDQKAEALENTADRPPTLQSYLLGQLAFSDVPESVMPVARLIIRDLDGNGYLRHPLRLSRALTRVAWGLAASGSACCCSLTGRTRQILWLSSCWKSTWRTSRRTSCPKSRRKRLKAWTP